MPETKGSILMWGREITSEQVMFPAHKNITRSEGEEMANWMDLMDDSSSIKTVFGDEIPSLSAVDLHEIRIDAYDKPSSIQQR